jgi:hypothetical protein
LLSWYYIFCWIDVKYQDNNFKPWCPLWTIFKTRHHNESVVFCKPKLSSAHNCGHC